MTSMYLVAELKVHDPEKLREYADRVMPVMEQFGGRIVAVSPRGVRPLEGDWRPDLLVIHRWRSRSDFEEFWSSSEYQPIRPLRHEACTSKIVVLDGLPEEHAIHGLATR